MPDINVSVYRFSPASVTDTTTGAGMRAQLQAALAADGIDTGTAANNPLVAFDMEIVRGEVIATVLWQA